MAIYYGLGGLNNRNLFPYSSGGNKAQSKALAGLISHGTSPWLAGGVFSLSPHMVSPLSLCIPGISPTSYKVISHIGLGTHQYGFHFYDLCNLCEHLISKYSHILRY